MTETEFKYDVFISYTSADKDWVRKVFVPAFEKAGLKCCEYYRDFDAGAPIVTEMENAILESRKTILVFSPKYLKSDWTKFETLMLQTLDAANQKRRLLPVIHKKCDLPLRISYLNCINLDHPDDIGIEWGRLFKALKVSRPPLVPKVIESWHFAHHYSDNPNFTGRVAERKMLSDWLKDDQNTLFVLRALGGFGKSALAWYWLHNDVSPEQFPKVVWWSFYEGDSSFDNFLIDTPEYLGEKDVKTMAARQQVNVLLGQLHDADILLVLDGFERTLRAFSGMGAAYQGDAEVKNAENEARGRDCVSPAAEDFLRGLKELKLRGKVLMTTRLRPHVLEGHDCSLQQRCCEEELNALQPADAYEFFTVKERIEGTRAEIEAACKPYDYHPLSLNLLAGLIKTDFEFPRDIRAAEKYKPIGHIKNHKEHILKASYETMPVELQHLLSKIACFRGSVDYATLKTVFGADHLDEALNDLQERGLLQVSALPNQKRGLAGVEVKFDLHPIVRRYAYDRLTAPDRAAAHQRLADFFEAVPKPEKVEKLDDLAPVIELYHHMVRAGQFEQAYELLTSRLVPNPLHFQFGAYQLIIELDWALFPDGEDKPPKLKDEAKHAWLYNSLAISHSQSGQPRRAVLLFEMQNVLQEKLDNKINLAAGLGSMAYMALVPIGALREAEQNLHRSIDLCRESKDEIREAIGHIELGHVLSYRGAWQEAEQELDAGLKLVKKQQAIQPEGIVWAYRALWHLLMVRAATPLSNGKSLMSAIQYAQRALELVDEFSKSEFPIERDYVRAHWLLGAAYRASNDLPHAETHLSEALRRCRANNTVEAEAEILLDIAKLRHAQGELTEALHLACEALIITGRSGYVLQGADVHLFLAALAWVGKKLNGERRMSDKECALMHAREALRLSTCDDPPDYTYKFAYDEALAMLKKLE